MPLKRYRVIVKVLCPSCVRAKNNGHIVRDCTTCQVIKYNNVTLLRKLTAYLDTKYPDWVWFRVYEYRPGEPGPELAVFRNWHNTYIQEGDKWIKTGRTREVPTCEQL